jgi:hypothetical protein
MQRENLEALERRACGFGVPGHVWREGGSVRDCGKRGWWMSEVKFGMTKKGRLRKSCGNCGPSRENGGWSKRQIERKAVGEYGEGEKEESWCFEFDQLGDRRVVDEGGRRVVVMGVKTVVADKETCLLLECQQDGSRTEEGGEEGRGVQWSRRTDRDCVTHCP